MSPFILIYLLIIIISISDSYRINSYLTDTSWKFIGKFCYDYNKKSDNSPIGIFEINISLYSNLTINNDDLKIVIYESNGRNWNNVSIFLFYYVIIIDCNFISIANV